MCKKCNEYKTAAPEVSYCWACFHTIVTAKRDTGRSASKPLEADFPNS